jgi:protein-disulfide isomerase
LRQKYGDRVRFVFRNYPLAKHEWAQFAAQAAYAASLQGKFWEMHDLMFQNQAQLSPSQYDAWAKQLGLDGKRWQASLASPAAKARIEDDSKLGNQVGANGTPTAFINCRQVVGAVPYDAFKKVVDEEIAKAEQLRKQGVKVDAAFYERVCDENVKLARK